MTRQDLIEAILEAVNSRQELEGKVGIKEIDKLLRSPKTTKAARRMLLSISQRDQRQGGRGVFNPARGRINRHGWKKIIDRAGK